MIGNTDIEIKMVLVGDLGTGKSSLLNTYVNQVFSENFS
jgi:GTPase SAR1 family protein